MSIQKAKSGVAGGKEWLMVNFLFAPIDGFFPKNPEFESILDNVRMLLEQCGNGVYQFLDQAKDIWERCNEWLCEYQDGKEKLIVALGNSVLDLAKNAAQVIKLEVNGFRFNKLCSLVLSVIEGHFSILQTSKNALAILVTGLEFYRVCVDLYQYGKKSEDSKPSFYKHAHDGARFLNVTWRNYGNKLFRLFHNLEGITISKLIFQIIFLSHKKNKDNQVAPLCSKAVAVSDYAYCEAKSYRTPPYSPFMAHPCPMTEIPVKDNGQFLLDRNLNGAVVELDTDKDTIWLGFTGSNSCSHLITDVVQIMGGPDSTYYAAVGIARTVTEKFRNKKIIITGHSLGGGLTQFAVSALMNPNVQGIGFNSAGLSQSAMDILKHHQSLNKENPSKKNEINMTHVVMKHDKVSMFGTLVGKVVVLNSKHRRTNAHKLRNVNKTINPQGPKYIVCKMSTNINDNLLQHSYEM